MKQAPLDSIVFHKGEYVVKVTNGTATVSVPRDITLGEIQPGLMSLVMDAARKKAGATA